MDELNCIDFFCGAGGLTCGLHKTGIDVDARCRHSFEVNNDTEFILEDVSKLAARDLRSRCTHGMYYAKIMQFER